MGAHRTGLAGRGAAARTLAILAGGLMLAACGGRGAALAPGPPTAPPQITAQWLRSQPGRQLDGFRFTLLDEQGRAVPDWRGVSVRALASTSARDFALSLDPAAPSELYLYVTYASGSWAAETAELSPARRADYLLLAVPRRIPDVLVIGAARLGPPADRAPAGDLLRLRFLPGSDSAFRAVSLVNADPASAPLLEFDPPPLPGANATLRWEERNIGDYNNNGQVEIADLTPIARLYRQTAATASDPAEFLLVDGDANGEVNAADLLPIARNYQRSIEGYSVFSAAGAAPADADYAPFAEPALERAAVLEATPAGELRHRLRYSYPFTPSLGLHSYRVRAWTDEDGSYAYGPPSNSIGITGAPGNAPPLWETTTGLTAAEPMTGGLRLRFGRAIDPEGGAVSYVLRYVQGSGPLTGPGVIEQKLPAVVAAGVPPYAYDLPGLASGTTYTLLLLAEDEAGLRTGNATLRQGTVPGLAAPADPWSNWRGNPARTGSNSSGVVREPLLPAWDKLLPDHPDGPAGPVASSSGWAGLNLSSGLVRFALGDGAAIGGALPGIPLPSGGAYLALAGTHAAGNASGGAALLDLGSGAAAQVASPDAARLVGDPLLLGDYLFGLTAGGTAFGSLASFSGSPGQPEWAAPAGPASVRPCSDGAALYSVTDAGLLRKHALLSGAEEASGQLQGESEAAGLACDVLGGQLLVASRSHGLSAYSLDSLDLLWQLPVDPDRAFATPPLAARQFSPPLAAVAIMRGDGSTEIVARNATGGGPAWSVVLPDCEPRSLTAGNARLLLVAHELAGDCIYVLHPEDGSLLQRLDIGFARSEAAPVADRLLAAHGAAGGFALTAYAAPAPPPALTWQGGAGIGAAAVEGIDGVRVNWDAALAPAGLVVRYALFYAPLPAPGPGAPPAFEPPYTGTTVISTLTAAEGSAGYLVAGLTPGQRYSFAVRAYYGRWGENAVTDGNVNWLACTPPWTAQPPLDLGAAPPPGGTQLPPGEVYQLKGVLDAAGRPHLVYNDEASTALTHVYQDAGGVWQVEAANLNAHIAADFELQWVNGRLSIAYADGVMGDEKVGLLTRTAADAWNDVAFASHTVANAQVSCLLGDPPPDAGPGALAYTEFTGGSLPTPRGEYYIVRTDALDEWVSSAPLDPDNYCGRDLSVALAPATLTPLIALQRGYYYAPNRLTPRSGELFFVADDGAGGYAFSLVDAGANPRADEFDADASDVGKRVQLALDSAGQPRLAYLDLNASASAPLGQLRYAAFDGTDWAVDTVHSFDLSIQTFASLQYTWGELSFALTPAGSPGGAGRPVIAMLARQTATSTANQAHLAFPVVFVGDGAGHWSCEQLDAALEAYPNDREPCVLLVTPGAWQYYTATTRTGTNTGAQRIVSWKRAL